MPGDDVPGDDVPVDHVPVDHVPVDDVPAEELTAEVARGGAGVVARLVARRAARSGALLGLLFGIMVLNEAVSYRTGFPTLESRAAFARSFGANAGLAAVIGPAREVDTIEGFVAWRMFGLMIIVGAIWGLLTSTRVLRGEEDTGRWELLLAGRTDRRGATMQALAGLAVGFAVLWALTAAFTVVAGTRPHVGFSASSSLFYATAGVASAGLFLAVGACTSQLAQTRRQANGLGAAAFGLCFLVRLIADGGSGVAWLRWASPLGWVENLRPLTGSAPLALVPVVALTAALGLGAVVLAGRRDVGAGVITRRDDRRASAHLLGGPFGLAVLLERWVVLAWVASLSVLALIFGVVAQTAGTAGLDDSVVEETVSRLGGAGGGAVAWIGYEFRYLAALLAFAAAGQIAAVRNEEADGHTDNLLARPASRSVWLAGRLGVAVGLVVLAGAGTAVGAWLGMVAGADVGVGDLLLAGVNVAVPGLFILGVGTLLYGVAPRWSAPLLYGLVLWSFLVEIIGSSLTSNHWLLDTAVTSHLGPVPASPFEVAPAAWLTGLGLLAALAGIAAFARRDLVAR